MAFVVLFSTMSFTVNMHFCGDTLVETVVFKKAKGCGMDKQLPSTDDNCSFTKKNCCNNKQLVVEGQDNLQLSFEQLTFQQQHFIVSFYTLYLDNFKEHSKETNAVRAYTPPLVVRQIYKFDETYLI